MHLQLLIIGVHLYMYYVLFNNNLYQMIIRINPQLIRLLDHSA